MKYIACLINWNRKQNLIKYAINTSTKLLLNSVHYVLSNWNEREVQLTLRSAVSQSVARGQRSHRGVPREVSRVGCQPPVLALQLQLLLWALHGPDRSRLLPQGYIFFPSKTLNTIFQLNVSFCLCISHIIHVPLLWVFAVLRLSVLLCDAPGHQGHGGRVHKLWGHRHELPGIPHHPQTSHQGQWWSARSARARLKLFQPPQVPV